MNEVKHTPGPWRAWQPRADESVPVRTDGLGITIAYVHQGAITNAKANARLIAAAPEMLDALKSARAVIQEDRDEIFDSVTVAGDESTMDDIDRPPVERMDAVLREIDAAIAKAKGLTP